MSIGEINTSLQESIKNNNLKILDAMSSAIAATNSSPNPFWKKTKVKKLQSLQSKYQKTGNPESLVNFILEAKQFRPSWFRIFFTKTNTFKKLEESFQNIIDLKNLLRISLSKPNIKADEVTTEWNQREPLLGPHGKETLTSTPTILESFSNEEDTLLTQTDPTLSERTDSEDSDLSSLSAETYDNIPDSLVDDSSSEVSSLTSSGISSDSQTTDFRQRIPRSRSKSPQVEDPLRSVDPEDITALADMARKIKMIKQDAIKQMLAERYGQTSHKKKTIVSDQKQATPEQLASLKDTLHNAGILYSADDGSLNQVTFGDEKADEEKLAIDTAAYLINEINLKDLAHNKELKIPKYLYKRIQGKAKMLEIMQRCHAAALPDDTGYTERCVQNMHEEGIDFSSLTYSKFYPFDQDTFNRLLQAGLTDAQKINKICEDILKVDTSTLIEKINRGFFVANKSDVKQSIFIDRLATALSAIGWSFQRLIAERDSLEAAGLKLEINLITAAIASETAETDATNNPTTNDPPGPPRGGLLAGIESRPKLRSTRPEAEESSSSNPPPPGLPRGGLLAGIESRPKLRSTRPEAEDSSSSNPTPPGPPRGGLLAGIESRPKLRSTRPEAEGSSSSNPTPPGPPRGGLLAGIESRPKLRSTRPEAEESSSSNPPGPPRSGLLAGIESRPKLKKSSARSGDSSQEPVAQTMAEKQAKLAGVMGGGASSIAKKPEKKYDLTGKNKITILTKNPGFIASATRYLEQRYNITRTEQDNGFEFMISSSKTPYANVEELKEDLQNFAIHLKGSGYTPFENLFEIEKYQPAFKKELNTQGSVVQTRPTLEIVYNTNYAKAQESFESLLTDNAVLFKKTINGYIIDASCWNTLLISRLRQARFTNDYFELIDSSGTRLPINVELNRKVPVVGFSLNIPTELQAECERIFSNHFSNDPEFYFDSTQLMIISKDMMNQFQQCLRELERSHQFSGEYIHTDDIDFSNYIQSQLKHRMKLSVAPKKDSPQLQNLLSNDANTRQVYADEVVYYFDLATLKNHKTEFFQLAASSECSIEYYDVELNKYQEIDLATDSQYKKTETKSTTSSQGLFSDVDETDSLSGSDDSTHRPFI